MIKSLNRAELRYLKRFLQFYSQKPSVNSLVLLEALESLNEYDEEELVRRLEKTNLRKNLAQAKHVLQRQFLKAMAAYGESNSVEDQLNEALRQARFLKSKGLFLQAQRLLRKIRPTAEQYEKFPQTVLIITQLHDLNRRLGLMENPELEADVRTLNQNLENWQNELNYVALSWRAHWTANALSGLNSPKELENYHQLLDSPLLADDAKPNSLVAKQIYYTERAMLEGYMGNLQEYFGYYREMINELNDELDRLADDALDRFVDSLTMYISIMVPLRQQHAYATYHSMLANLPERFKLEDDYARLVRYISVSIEMFRLGFDGHFNEAAKLIPQQQALEPYFWSYHHVNGLFLRAKTYFGQSKMKEAHSTLEQYWDMTREEGCGPFAFFEVMAHFLGMFIQLERRNYRELGRLLRRYYRLVRRDRELNEVETVLVYFFRRVLREQEETALPHIAADTLERSRQIPQFPMKVRYLIALDWETWLEACAKNGEYAEFLRRKAVV